jgi:flagellar motility protein MotE (MotC chaperone)
VQRADPRRALLKEKQIGAILAAMNRERAVAVTKALAGS